MKKLRKSQLKLIVLAASCVAVGVGISAITSAGAATGGAAAHRAKATGKHQRAQGRRARRALLRAVHGDLVVATKSGFANVTFDRGSVESVSGQQLTLREGTKQRTYKTVTLTIPAGAVIRSNRQASTLAKLTPGERVLVFHGPKRTLVSAHTAKTP